MGRSGNLVTLICARYQAMAAGQHLARPVRRYRARNREMSAMAIDMVVRRKGDYKDPQLARLREKGVPLLQKYGATAHSFGYYHSGAHSGQICIVITYPDLATHERAWQAMSRDADWKTVVGEIEQIAPLQESYLTVVTEVR
jgi:NIPSNAP